MMDPFIQPNAVPTELFSLNDSVVSAIVNSFFMILVTEIGDKTFFIAAVLAMRNGRLIVYAGAMGKLLVDQFNFYVVNQNFSSCTL